MAIIIVVALSANVYIATFTQYLMFRLILSAKVLVPSPVTESKN